MNKKETRHKRLSIINELSRLEALNCRNCPLRACGSVNTLPEKRCKGCETFTQIRTLGDELDVLAQSTKQLMIPKELTLSAYYYLIENEWTEHAIRKHYKIDTNAMNYFLIAHGLKDEKLLRKGVRS